MTQQETNAVEKQVIIDCLNEKASLLAGYEAIPSQRFEIVANEIQRKLDELRKPIERPQIERQPIVIERFSDNGEHSHWELINKEDGDILWSENSEPEANVCEAGKELVPEIGAALMQPDKELLEAAKDALRTFYGIGCNEEAEIVQVLTKAILNYEKQSK